MLKSKTSAPLGDPLCFCEYYNEAGDRSHILACCCDCEAVDHACDRILTCNSIPQETCDKVMFTISDRLRIPWCSGKGAVQIPLDIAVPIILVPLGLLLATIGPIFSCLMLILMPSLVLLFHRMWTRTHTGQRTRLFYVWGLASSFVMLYIFEVIVMCLREILLWENMLLLTIYALMMYAMVRARKTPGIISRERTRDNKVSHNKGILNGSAVIEMCSNSMEKFDTRGQYSMESHAYDRDSIQKSYQEVMEEADVETIVAKDVTWVDSRSIESGKLSLWCSQCKIKRPPRSGHCPLCNACINMRDHHCVWIDTCIGASNHRSFFCALVLFIVGGFYGAHLTLTSLCTPEIYLDWFLLPSDCRFLYSDFPSALCFVSSCYTILACCGMTLVLLNQVILISQNLTSQELHQAQKRGWTKWGIYAINNVNNRGLLRNWQDFITGRRKLHQSYTNVPV